MDGIILPILIASTVAMLVWGMCRLFVGTATVQRRRLHERLSTEVRADSQSSAAGGLRLNRQMEVQGVPAFLAQVGFIQALHRRLVQAYPDQTLGRFLFKSAAFGIALFVVVFMVSAMPLAALGAGAAGAYLPFFLLGSKRAKRQKQIALQIPEALDFLSRVLRAGHSLSTGLQMMSEELPQPMSAEFRRCYDQHSLGQSLDDTLKDMAARIESTDFAFFVTAVLIQRQTGGDLSEVLRNISGMIRGRIRLQQHVKAKTAEGRFTGYVLVAFPAVMFVLAYVMNPGYAGILLHTSSGRMLLGTAFGLMMLGLFAIRKITTVRV